MKSPGDGSGGSLAEGGAGPGAVGATNSAVSGSGGFDGTSGVGGTGGGEPQCGPTRFDTWQDGVCPPGQVCRSCFSDTKQTEYWCKDDPVPAADEFSCYDRVCEVGTHCELTDDEFCSGNYFAFCYPAPKACEADPSCACMKTLPCVYDCFGAPETGVVVYIDPFCKQP